MSIYQVLNPATGEVVETYPTATDEQIADPAAQRGCVQVVVADDGGRACRDSDEGRGYLW